MMLKYSKFYPEFKRETQENNYILTSKLPWLLLEGGFFLKQYILK